MKLQDMKTSAETDDKKWLSFGKNFVRIPEKLKKEPALA
jgi:hypothetical protein